MLHAEAQRVEVFRRAAAAVVCIFVDRERSSGGSGVIIHPDGYGLTNFHVVQPFLDTRRGFGGLTDGRLYPLRVLGIDPGGDIAMFKLQVPTPGDHQARADPAADAERPAPSPSAPHSPALPSAPLGDSDALYVGQQVAAMGNPFLLAEDFIPTITMGIISGLHRYQYGQGNLLEYADCIQVSTSINPGNSGGPLFDLAGRVIGINGRASFEERGRVNVGLGYAVSINQIRRFLPGLRAGRMVEHGTLGMTVRRIGDELVVDAVQEPGPAERAGIQLRDVLTHVAGRPVRTPNQFNNAQAILPADWPVELRFLRGGRPMQAVVRTERVSVRMPVVYLLDLQHNHAEIRSLLDRFESGARLRAAASDAALLIRGQATCQIHSQPHAIELRIAPDEAASAAAAPTPAPDPDAAAHRQQLHAECRQILAPLCLAQQIDLGWEMLGGDEVAGRIVSVIERRLDAGQRLRWKFDYDTDALVQAAFGTEDAPEQVLWTVSQPADIGPVRFPQRWLRSAPGQPDVELRFETIEPQRAPSSAPASTPPAGAGPENGR